jgi:PEGA domain
MHAYRVAVLLTGVLVIIPFTPTRALAQRRGETGSLSVKTVPADAQIYIDGERWVGPETDGRLVVQVPAGRHTVEVRAPGYRSYVADVDVRAGETTPVNVSLGAAATERQAPPDPPQTAGRGITQVSDEGEESGLAFSPDYRFADVNHHVANLLGGYGGVVFGGHLFIGAGGYWQLDDSRGNVSLAYGGGVFEWREWNDRRIGATLHALVGGGDARIRDAVAFPVGPRPQQGMFRNGRDGFFFDDHEGFFVFEPEAQVNVRVARNLRVSAGVGYRVTATDRRVSSDVLNGLSGTISVRFGK